MMRSVPAQLASSVPARFEEGYVDGMNQRTNERAKLDPAYINGWNNGVLALNNSVPFAVHHMLQLLSAHAHSEADSALTMTTPPLSSFSRRSVHVLLTPIRDKISIAVKGRKHDQERRIVMRYPKAKMPETKAKMPETKTKMPETKADDIKVVAILRRQDRVSSNASAEPPEGAQCPQ